VAEWQPVDESAFVEQFNWSQKQFAEGALKKTVPIIAQQGRIDFRNAHLIKTLISILSEKHYGTTYGFWDNGEGYLGHTPELILDWSMSDQILRTMALAGTKDARKESTSEILHDSKILDEHQIVIDDLKSVLAKVDPTKKIEIDPIKVLELKYLCHLQTEIRIPNLTADDVLNYIHAIHPTAALGLYPRVSEGYSVFKNFPLQNARRNFAAPFAFIHKDHVKAVAAIRLFYFNSSEVKIISGCGVTAGSVLADELHELENKRNSVKRMMGMNV